MVNFEAIIFYLVLLDSIGAIAISFCCAGWYKKKFKGFWKHFPASKGWSLFYFILVLWIGYGLMRLGII